MAIFLTFSFMQFFILCLVNCQEDYDDYDSSEQEYYDSYFTQYYGSYFGSYYGCYISGYYGIFYEGDYSTPLNYAMEGFSRNDWVDTVGVNDIIVPDFACHSENENNLVSGLLRDKEINKDMMESCSAKNWQGTCYNDCVLLKLDIITSNPTVDNRVNITLNTEDKMAQEMKENLFNEESERIATKIARKITEDCSVFDASIDIYQPCEAKTDLYECVTRSLGMQAVLKKDNLGLLLLRFVPPK